MINYIELSLVSKMSQVKDMGNQQENKWHKPSCQTKFHGKKRCNYFAAKDNNLKLPWRKGNVNQ